MLAAALPHPVTLSTSTWISHGSGSVAIRLTGVWLAAGVAAAELSEPSSGREPNQTRGPTGARDAQIAIDLRSDQGSTSRLVTGRPAICRASRSEMPSAVA